MKCGVNVIRSTYACMTVDVALFLYLGFRIPCRETDTYTSMRWWITKRMPFATNNSPTTHTLDPKSIYFGCAHESISPDIGVYTSNVEPNPPSNHPSPSIFHHAPFMRGARDDIQNNNATLLLLLPLMGAAHSLEIVAIYFATQSHYSLMQNTDENIRLVVVFLSRQPHRTTLRIHFCFEYQSMLPSKGESCAPYT